MLRFLLLIGVFHSSLGIAINYTVSGMLKNKETKDSTGCTLNIDSSHAEPVIVDSNTLEYIYPDSSELDISLKSGSKIILGCPGAVLNYGSSTSNVIEATCISGSTFLVEGQNVSISNPSCSKSSTSTARYTGKTCESDGVEIEIGFALNSTAFVRLMRICFDDKLKSPLYSYYQLKAKINYAQTGVARLNFKEGSFYGLNSSLDTLYERNVQKTTINNQVGLPANSTQYVHDTSDFYLARGHLTAKTDFVYASQQKATFWYVNTAPQWQTVNAANWNSIEDSVRAYAFNNEVDLEVYTGVYGVSTLPNEATNKANELYLSRDDNNNVALPIPAVYWKLIYNNNTKENVVLFSANNPYESNPGTVCEDVSDSLSWVTWKKDNQTKGISYACSAKGLNKIITYLPDLEYGDLII